jgi:hypothetical protein
VTALEAHDFFREISFLTGDENEHARRMFKGFLARAAGGVSGFSALDLLAAFAGGALLGPLALFVAAAAKREPATAVEASALAIMQYPWAAQILLFGGLAYAGAGAFMSLFAGPLTDRVADKARTEALTALRSGFAAKSALNPADVTRRIKDAVDIFRARVGGAGGGNQGRNQSASANHGTAFSTEDEVPEWRRRDSSVKFVDAGFSPAPQRWRTDAYAKKFEASKDGETGSKRGGEGLKNRPRD